MVTKEHEAPIEVFARFPILLTLLLREMKVAIDIPDDADVEFVSERCTENTPGEMIADEVPLLKVDGVNQAAVVFEVQRDHVERKLGVWPRYVAAVWDRFRVPTVLLVYCEDLGEAKKASQPIHMGPGNVVTPFVVSPKTLPPISDVDAYADRVDLAVFAAVLHAGGPHAEQTLTNLTHLLATIGKEQAEQYAGCLIEILPEAARTYLEDLMTTAAHPYQSAFSRMEQRGEAKGEIRGEARGEAKMLLRMFAMRGFEVTDEIRDRIRSCTDTTRLEAWADALPTAQTVDDVFTSE